MLLEVGKCIFVVGLVVAQFPVFCYLVLLSSHPRALWEPLIGWLKMDFISFQANNNDSLCASLLSSELAIPGIYLVHDFITYEEEQVSVASFLRKHFIL